MNQWIHYISNRKRTLNRNGISFFILVYFRSGSLGIRDLLANPKDQLQATEEELNYIDVLLKIQWKTQLFHRRGNDNISTVIDGFLYLSNMADATNIKLLKQYNIRHIVSVCNCPPSQHVLDNFNVLWINVVNNLHTNLWPYFERTNDLLHSARNSQEKILVHCKAGISGSSTIVLAYLIK